MKKLEIYFYWILIVLVGILFVSSGYPKIMGGDSMIRRFEAWGYGVSFMRLIGVLEVLGGLLLFIPKLAHYAATLLAVIMIGATYTHLSTGIGGPQFSLGVLFILLLILFLLKNKIKKLFSNNPK